MIYLDENYRLVSVPNNIIIEGKSTASNDKDEIDEIDDDKKSTKKRLWKVKGYFPNVESALRFYVSDKIGDFVGSHDVVTDLKTVISKTEELKKEIGDMFDMEENNG